MLLKFILQAGNWYNLWDSIEKSVPIADEIGYWGFALPDHYMWGEDRGGDSTLETWIALTYLAGRTQKLHFGTLVTPIPFRPPGMLAKQISTLDLISKGRTFLGVGAGWSQTEFEGYRVWDPARIRVDKTLEGLKLILELWTKSEKVDYTGKYYSAKRAVLEPKPVQKPYPPLLFGGVSPRMLRMAGKYADICLIPPWVELGFEKAKNLVLEAAQKNSRKEKIRFASLSFNREGYDRTNVSKQVSDAMNKGMEYFIVGFPRDKYTESMQDFAKNVIPSYA